MTVNELIEELIGYRMMGMADEEVRMCITDPTGCGKAQEAAIQRTEPGDGIEDVYLLDEETP